MINMEVLRLEINELLYHIDVFLSEYKKISIEEVIKEIVNGYLFPSSNNKSNTSSINLVLNSLAVVMHTDEYNILLKNISTLTRFIKDYN